MLVVIFYIFTLSLNQVLRYVMLEIVASFLYIFFISYEVQFREQLFLFFFVILLECLIQYFVG